MATIAFRLNKNLFLRDPQASELGEKIISHSIALIDQLGFEQFTFKKLAEKIDSTEASIYRYFENKHKLLLYLIDWYWTWLERRMEFNIQNLHDPVDKLKALLHTLTEEKEYDPDIAFVDEAMLQRIVVSEFEKTYLTKNVDHDNKEGLFLPYKSVCKKIADAISEINSSYTHAHSLASTIMLSANHQLYYAKHLPSLTDIRYEPHAHHNQVYEFLITLTLNTIQS
jgi:AcrR family transcriptional regulator